MTDDERFIEGRTDIFMRMSMLEESRMYAAELLEYAQYTGHSRISLWDIREQFDIGKLQARLTKMMYEELWNQRNPLLDRIPKVLKR